MSAVKPMLAGKIEEDSQLDKLFPMWASPKLDGIRAMVIDNIVYSRNMKPIPNRHVQKLFGRSELNGFDGELIVGLPTDPEVFRKTTSGVMSEDGEPNVAFYVFDRFDRPNMLYSERRALVHGNGVVLPPNVIPLTDFKVHSHEELAGIEKTWLEVGYEGVMLRTDKKYKFGRASIKSAEILKLKRFEDAEAEIIGFEELMSNQNEATLNVFGRTERSTHKDGMVPMGTLGALTVRGINGDFEGVEFSLGSGYTAAERAGIWKRAKDSGILGKIVRYKYFKIGIKDKPRFPIYQGFRDPNDM
jgi:DNA ligase-1